MQDTWVESLDGEDPLEEEMATHSSILVWEIPWTEEPGGLQSIGSQKSRTTKQHERENVTYTTSSILSSCNQMNQYWRRGHSQTVNHRLA